MPDGEVRSLAQCGLVQTLAEAARLEGHTHWWVAEDLVVGVRAYLMWHRGGQLIEARELSSALATALVATGHPEIARRLFTPADPARICLDTMAQEAVREGGCYELTFEALLKQALDQLVLGTSTKAYFAKLQAAVRTLLGEQATARDCELLQEHIVAKIHAHITRSGKAMRLAMTL
jgi:hypothetical protein